MLTDKSAAELAADLRAARRQVDDLQLRLREETARADRAERLLEAKTAEASRLYIERDQLREAGALAAALDAREVATRRAQAERHRTIPTQLAAFMADGLAVSLPDFLYLLRQKVLGWKPGRLLSVRLHASIDSLAPKEVPDRPSLRRQNILTSVELMQKDGLIPVLFRIESSSGMRAGLIGWRVDDEDRAAPAAPEGSGRS